MNQIITEAIRQGAGDIYIEPKETELRVRYRIDGVCQEITRMPQEDAPPAHQPPQDQLGHGHRRAARPAGRPLRRRARRQGGRLPRRGPADRLRRARRPASAAPRLDHDVAQGPRLPRVQPQARCSRRSRCRTAPSSSPGRPARASRRRCTPPSTRRTTRRPTSSPSRTRSSTGSPGSRRCRCTRRRA